MPKLLLSYGGSHGDILGGARTFEPTEEEVGVRKNPTNVGLS